MHVSEWVTGTTASMATTPIYGGRLSSLFVQTAVFGQNFVVSHSNRLALCAVWVTLCLRVEAYALTTSMTVTILMLSNPSVHLVVI